MHVTRGRGKKRMKSHTPRHPAKALQRHRRPALAHLHKRTQTYTNVHKRTQTYREHMLAHFTDRQIDRHTHIHPQKRTESTCLLTEPPSVIMPLTQQQAKHGHHGTQQHWTGSVCGGKKSGCGSTGRGVIRTLNGAAPKTSFEKECK